MQLPSFSVYGNYSGNYGSHALRFDGPGGTFWFSYTTLVAFRAPDGETIVHENDWGPTTGKHLNAIDYGDKKSRLSSSAFKAAYDSAFAGKVDA